MSSLHGDSKPILNNETGPKMFRIGRSNTRLAVSGPGTLQSWTGVDWDAGIAFTESSTITSPGTYQLTLDIAGNASIQEASRP